MADKIKVKAAKAKVVFLPGYGQVVCDPTSKDKAKSNPEVPAKFIDRLVEEGAIVRPKGYKSPAEQRAEIEQAKLDALSVGAAQPDLVELTTFSMVGLTITETGGGCYEITGEGISDPIKEQGEEKAKQRFAELVAEIVTGPPDSANAPPA